MRKINLWIPALLVPCLCLAQITGGSFTGVVTDASGEAVADARVDARNLGTNVVTTTSTTEQGLYEFPLLPAGLYTLSVERSGFQRATTGELRLNSGTRPKIDVSLAVGRFRSPWRWSAKCRW